MCSHVEEHSDFLQSRDALELELEYAICECLQ